VVLDRPMMIALIKTTLNHGVYTTRTATSATEVAAALTDWQPSANPPGAETWLARSDDIVFN
jgi:CheY-like chemotaxis protein